MEVIYNMIYSTTWCGQQNTDTKYCELFKEYIVVGGMPRMVDDFATIHNFAVF